MCFPLDDYDQSGKYVIPDALNFIQNFSFK